MFNRKVVVAALRGRPKKTANKRKYNRVCPHPSFASQMPPSPGGRLNLAPLPKGGWIFNRLRLKKTGGFFYKLTAEFNEIGFLSPPSPAVTPPSSEGGCPPGSWLSLFHRRKRRSPFPSGKAALRVIYLRREQSPRPTVNWLFCGTVRTVPYGGIKNGRIYPPVNYDFDNKGTLILIKNILVAVKRPGFEHRGIKVLFFYIHCKNSAVAIGFAAVFALFCCAGRIKRVLNFAGF